MTAAPPPTIRSVLGTPAVARLFATSLLARLPLAAVGIVAILRTRELTGSFAAGGAAAAAFALANGASAPLLARLVDRVGQAQVLAPAALAAAAALAVFAALPAGTPVAAILVTTFVAGLAMPPIGASMRALLPDLMPDAEGLRGAYALESSALELTYVAGPLLLAGVLASWSTAAAALACSALLLAGTFAFIAAPASRAWRPKGATPAGHGVLGPLRSAGVRTLVVLLALVGLTFGAVEVAVPVAADHAGHPSVAGALLSVWGLGSLLGGLLAMRLRRPAGPVARLAAALAALAAGHVVLRAAADDLLALAPLLLLAGLAIAPSMAAAFGLADALAPPGTLTETFAWLGTAIAAGIAAGGALGGWVAEAGGAGGALLIPGAAAVAAVLVLGLRRRTLLG